MNLILLGAPGSGKGTQAQMLTDRFGFFYLQTGTLARKWAEEEPRIADMVNNGKLIPEKEMTEYVMKYLEKNVPERSNILFEGFPRFISQYKSYEHWLNEKGKKVDLVVALDLSEERAAQRLASRRICDNCGEIFNVITNPPKVDGVCDKCGASLSVRKDDKPDSIDVRFDYFHKNTQKLIEYLDGLGILLRVDADRSIDVIHADLVREIESRMKQS